MNARSSRCALLLLIYRLQLTLHGLHAIFKSSTEARRMGIYLSSLFMYVEQESIIGLGPRCTYLRLSVY